MELKDILVELVKKGLDVSLNFNQVEDIFYIDLNTQAKSHLHLYQDGKLVGRYGSSSIDLNQNIESIIIDLCYEFNNALCRRTYGNSDWFRLCEENNIKTESYI